MLLEASLLYRTTARWAAILCLAVAVLSMAPQALADDILWVGATNGTSDWNTASNWTNNVVPDASTNRADLRKDWASAPVINLSAAVTINGILFDDTGASGDTTLTIGNGGNAANTMTLAGTTSTISVTASSLTNSANLLGSGGFTKSGGGILVLSGSNSISGDVIISAGTLRTGNANALNSVSAVRLDSGATLSVNSSVSIAGLNDNAGSGGTVNNASGGGKALTVAGSSSYSFNGSFTGSASGTKVGLVLSGTGTQTLGGNNTTNIGYQFVTGGGTLIFSRQNSIFQGLSAGAVTNGNLTANSGIYVSSNSTVALGVGDSASGYFDSTAIATFVDGTHMGASTTTTGFASGSILGFDTTSATGGTFTYTNALTNLGTSSSIGLAKLGTGTLVLDAANTYNGVTQVRVGTLQIGAGSTTGSISNTSGITVSSGATLAFNRSDTALTLAAKITGAGSVLQSGSGATTLNATDSDYSGGTTISGGRLTAKSLGSGAVTINGSGATQLKLSASTTYSNSISIGASTGTANQGLIDTDTGINAVLTGPISITGTPSMSTAGHFGSSGTGSIRIDGAISSTVPVIFRRGTIILTATNGYSTSTVISNGGTLQIGNGTDAGSIGSTSAITNNGALVYNVGSGTRTNGAVISGNGTLTQNSSGGTLKLTGANSYTGTTVISAGTLQVGNGTDAGSIGSTSAITNNGALVYNVGSGTRTNGAVINGSGTLTQNSSGGTLKLTGANTYSGATIISAGTLQVGDGTDAGSIGSTSAITNNGALVYNVGSGTRTNGAVISGNGTLTQNSSGGTLKLTGANTYNGATIISAGTLQIGNGGTTGSIASTSGVTNNGTLAYNRSDNLTAAYAITGGGNVTKSGAGTLSLSGANSYSGGTLVSTGTLKGDTTSLQGAITNNAAAIFDTATNGTYAGVMSGTGTLAKSGAGTLTLTATNTYNGATTVDAGKLVVNGAISNSAVTVQSSAILGGSGVVGSTTVLNGATIAPGNSPGALTINGDLTWNNGGNYDWEVLKLPSAGIAGTDWDLLSVSGTLNLTNLSGAPLFKINLYSSTLAGWSTTGTYAWKILEAGNAISTNYISSSFIGINTSNFTNDISGGLFALELRDNSKGLYLTYKGGGEPIPEPGTWAAAAMLIGTAALLRWRRRRCQRN